MKSNKKAPPIPTQLGHARLKKWAADLGLKCLSPAWPSQARSIVVGPARPWTPLLNFMSWLWFHVSVLDPCPSVKKMIHNCLYWCTYWKWIYQESKISKHIWILKKNGNFYNLCFLVYLLHFVCVSISPLRCFQWCGCKGISNSHFLLPENNQIWNLFLVPIYCCLIHTSVYKHILKKKKKTPMIGAVFCSFIESKFWAFVFNLQKLQKCF